jgi:hypothetical protein
LQIHRLGYSKKGWTDGEIGVEYIKDFHEQTKDKVKACTQVLLVDGHNSHYTLGFLLFARTHRIHVLCYPAHGTHVYQGLDVVIFGPLKVFWTQEKDKWTREKRTKIDKTNFLWIYVAAHVRALTPSNIKAAFKKMGVVPFNRSVVTPAMMAPSLETSCHGSLPIAPSTPIRAVTNLFHRAQKHARNVPAAAAADPEDTNGNSEAEELSPCTPQRRRPENPFSSPIRKAIETLRTSSTSFIFSSSPIQAASDPPLFTLHAISPQNPKYAHLLAEMPMTVREHDLQEALREVSTTNSSHKTQIIIMQSSLVLNGVYVDSVC